MGAGRNQSYILDLKCGKGGQEMQLLMMQRDFNC